MLRKQVKDITSSAPSKDQLTQLQKTVTERDCELDKFKFQLESLKKEDNAFTILKADLNEKAREKAELKEQLTAKEAELEAKVNKKNYSFLVLHGKKILEQFDKTYLLQTVDMLFLIFPRTMISRKLRRKKIS